MLLSLSKDPFSLLFLPCRSRACSLQSESQHGCEQGSNLPFRGKSSWAGTQVQQAGEVCLALELVGSWVVLGFSVGMEAFDELLSINVPWSPESSGVLRIWT